MANHNDMSGTPLPERKTGKIEYTEVSLPIKPRPDTNPNRRAYAQITVPWLNLKGKWLQEAGFEIGTPIIIMVAPGRLVISIETEANAAID